MTGPHPHPHSLKCTRWPREGARGTEQRSPFMPVKGTAVAGLSCSFLGCGALGAPLLWRPPLPVPLELLWRWTPVHTGPDTGSGPGRLRGQGLAGSPPCHRCSGSRGKVNTARGLWLPCPGEGLGSRRRLGLDTCLPLPSSRAGLLQPSWPWP